MASVVGLGYTLVSATDLTAWREFAVDLLGLQIAEENQDRLLLRMDQQAYRIDIRRGASDRVTTLGWEVTGQRELDQLAAALEAAGFAVTSGKDDECRERMVSGLIRFEDPEGTTAEIFYGLKKERGPFISPTGARFKTGAQGLGHAFQMVDDEEAYRALYQDVLGFRLSDFIDFAPGLAGTFLHCGRRHHSFAYAPFPRGPRGVGHLMFEVDDLDVVGRAWDKVVAGAAPVALTFGRHTNDEMISFYAVSPSGFQVEYGFGGREIDDATFRPSRYDRASYWGHVRTDPTEPDV